MAVDKLVDSTQLDTDLTSVANAIRTKGGTSAQLAFPAGFVSAIEAIQTGGGGIPGVTVLRGVGTTHVDLPSGFSFPAVSDCTKDPDTTFGSPFVGVLLVYADIKSTDMIDGTSTNKRVMGTFVGNTSNVSYTERPTAQSCTFSTLGGDTLQFSTDYQGKLYFYSGDNGGMGSYSASADGGWMIIVVDERGLSV